MLELNVTAAVNNLIAGKASAQEQTICGIALKALIVKKKPNYNEHNRPYCPKCDQPLNIKLKDGKNIYEYCKCCGQGIDWE